MSSQPHPHSRRATAKSQSLLIESLVEALTLEVGQSEPLSFFEFAAKVPEPKTGPLDFDRFPFQREWYAETAEDQEIVIKKSAQVGVSAFVVRWAIYWPDKGYSSLYIFPK